MGQGKSKKPIKRTRNSGEERPPHPKPRLFDWSKYDPAMAQQDNGDTLADELVTYRDRLKDLLKNKGEFVLIKGREVVGIYESRDDALKQAVNRFQDAPVLIKQIVAKEAVRDFGGAAF